MTQNKTLVSQGIVITGILSLTAIELFAIATGHNGTMRMIIIAVIAAAIGIGVPIDKFLKK